MKKIVGIMAVAAMATSMFATDVSAALKFNGSLFDMEFKDGAKPSALTLKTPEGRKPWGNTGIDLNVSSDKAGATINIDATGKAAGFKTWVQPADFVKINFGDLDYCLNKESIDYAGSVNGTGSNGIAADFTFGAVSVNAILNPGFGNAWFDGAIVKNTAVMAKYGAGFGTIGFAWIGSPSAAEAATEAVKKGEYKPSDYEINKKGEVVLKKGAKPAEKDVDAKAAVEAKSFAENTFSLGYSGAFGPVSLFTDAALVVKPYETKVLSDVKADLFVKANVSGLTAVAYADFDYSVASNKVASVGAKAKVSYNLGAVTPYLYVKDANFTKTGNDFEMTVKPGMTFNVGAAGFEVAADFTISGATGGSKVSVPFSVNVNF